MISSSIVATMAAKAHEVSSKPSNPKDVVGSLKAPMSTVSAPVLMEVGIGMLEGTVKYGRHNYRAVGVRASVYYDATMRHVFAWWEGEDIDPDSGAKLSHITKAIASLAVLRDAMIQGKLTDDRPPSSPPGWIRGLNAAAEAVTKQHAGKSPRHYTINDNAECHDTTNQERSPEVVRERSEPETVCRHSRTGRHHWVSGHSDPQDVLDKFVCVLCERGEAGSSDGESGQESRKG